MKYILASASPRRKELLQMAGFDFEIIPSTVEEIITKEIPYEIVMELAKQKAEDVLDSLECKEDTLVIGADTVVVYHGEILGKPKDKQEAYDMLSMLADRTHEVYTGIALARYVNGKKKVKTFYEKSSVVFYPVSKEDLRRYVDTGDSLDKAGAYGIQGPFGIHVKEITGEYNNIVGLPIGRLYQELINL